MPGIKRVDVEKAKMAAKQEGYQLGHDEAMAFMQKRLVEVKSHTAQNSFQEGFDKAVELGKHKLAAAEADMYRKGYAAGRCVEFTPAVDMLAALKRKADANGSIAVFFIITTVLAVLSLIAVVVK